MYDYIRCSAKKKQQKTRQVNNSQLFQYDNKYQLSDK